MDSRHDPSRLKARGERIGGNGEPFPPSLSLSVASGHSESIYYSYSSCIESCLSHHLSQTFFRGGGNGKARSPFVPPSNVTPMACHVTPSPHQQGASR